MSENWNFFWSFWTTNFFSRNDFCNFLINFFYWIYNDFSGVSIIISHERDFLSQVSNIIRVIQDKELRVYEDVDKGFGVIGFKKTPEK
jgi:hypothetical protein